MPAILIYLLKVNVALLLFCLCYYAILRKLTFYTLNRVYLITAILFSSLYPLVDFTSFMQRNEKLAQPIQFVVLNLNTRVANFAKPAVQTNYWEWLVMLFWIGVIVMALRLAMQFISLYRIYCRSKPALIKDHKVRIIDDKANPFAFWQSIYINPTNHSADELHSIIAHEYVHVSQWHTLDILLAEVSLVFYWFNPGVWLMKKAVAENLEFITDRKILQQGINAKSYQYSLLYASFNTSPNAMVNNFNISTIKKRIMMMNSKKSSAYSLSRYGLIAPAVLALVLVFGTTKAELLKEGAHAAKKATEEAITAVNRSLNTHTINVKTASLVKKVQESTVKLTNYITKSGKPNTSIKLSAVTSSTDTSKYKPSVTMHFSGPDTGYYVVDGKPILSSQMTTINPDDIVSINIVGEQNSDKIFGKNASKGAVLIVTKAGEKSEVVKNLLKQISEAKGTATAKESGIYNISPPKGSLNSITITSAGDSLNSKVKTSLTVTGSSSYSADKKRFGVANVNVASVTYIKSNSSKPSNLPKENSKAVVAYGTSQTMTATDILKGWGIKEDITAKNVFSTKPNVTIKASGNNDPLYIVDGKVLDATTLKNLNPNTIESIDVLKNESGAKLYGEKAKNGVVIIATKEATNAKIKQMVIKGQSGPNDPLYVIDGKPVVGNTPKVLNPATIESVAVFKDASATALYGEKGKNGVIIITTKGGNKADTLKILEPKN